MLKSQSFRDAPNLLFNIKNDLNEQKNLIDSTKSEVVKVKEYLRQHIKDTFNFDEVEQKRIKWTNRLAEKFPLGIPKTIKDGMGII